MKRKDVVICLFITIVVRFWGFQKYHIQCSKIWHGWERHFGHY
ncbi:hypothetical protein [Bacillus sp. AP8]|nr:hypothetical protein [Bacillus sp. AP8]